MSIIVYQSSRRNIRKGLNFQRRTGHSEAGIQCLLLNFYYFSYKFPVLNNEAFEAHWLLYVPPGLTFTISTFSSRHVFKCSVWILFPYTTLTDWFL
jgi:hypothetical protein